VPPDDQVGHCRSSYPLLSAGGHISPHVSLARRTRCRRCSDTRTSPWSNRAKVERLHEAFADPGLRDEALGILRGLIERVVHPGDDGPQIELVGENRTGGVAPTDGKQAALSKGGGLFGQGGCGGSQPPIPNMHSVGSAASSARVRSRQLTGLWLRRALQLRLARLRVAVAGDQDVGTPRSCSASATGVASSPRD